VLKRSSFVFALATRIIAMNPQDGYDSRSQISLQPYCVHDISDDSKIVDESQSQSPTSKDCGEPSKDCGETSSDVMDQLTVKAAQTLSEQAKENWGKAKTVVWDTRRDFSEWSQEFVAARQRKEWLSAVSNMFSSTGVFFAKVCNSRQNLEANGDGSVPLDGIPRMDSGYSLSDARGLGDLTATHGISMPYLVDGKSPLPATNELKSTGSESASSKSVEVEQSHGELEVEQSLEAQTDRW